MGLRVKLTLVCLVAFLTQKEFDSKALGNMVENVVDAKSATMSLIEGKNLGRLIHLLKVLYQKRRKRTATFFE